MAPSASRGSRGTHPTLTARTLPLRWSVLRHRRRLSALCGLLAAAATVLALRPVEGESVAVLTAAHDLTASDAVDGSAVTVRSVPPALVPAGALPSDADLTTARLNAPVGEGEILTVARLSEPAAADYGPDLVAAPVRIADPGVAELVAPGTRIDVLATTETEVGLSGGGAAVVASDRLVMTVPDAEGATGGDALLLVAVTEDEARALASSAVDGRLSVTIRSR
ncbi:Flp pilus assembly protein CpaB [Spiractinospora alimapuensis]|uniref:SAF domain-containing protein n=1 Tax=Spiractinospora alimapuensis TaxID=2820884 RepID=UPI001F24A77B|nr:SAF domain-containing protein [Spiractinospora alimapuensis]QVQ51335.1 Flp pilus assembly protein CpaB [Spiractinospora alimapuensis]